MILSLNPLDGSSLHSFLSDTPFKSGTTHSSICVTYAAWPNIKLQCHNIYFQLHSFLAGILYWWQEMTVKPFLQSFPAHPKDNGVIVRSLWWPICENDSLTLMLLLVLHSFTTSAWWILALLSWNMPGPSGKKKINWWDNLAIQYIQALCRLAVPRPDQLKQPQIITQQFADLKRNDDFFFFGQAVHSKSLL